VRDSPSLVWGRPAKSVVERPRGFNSHIPRHLRFRVISVAVFGNYAHSIVGNYDILPRTRCLNYTRVVCNNRISTSPKLIASEINYLTLKAIRTKGSHPIGDELGRDLNHFWFESN
jgi:hypothetical protein